MVNKTNCPVSFSVFIFLETIFSVTKIIFIDNKIVFSIQRIEEYYIVRKSQWAIFTTPESERPIFCYSVQLYNIFQSHHPKLTGYPVIVLNPYFFNNNNNNNNSEMSKNNHNS